MTELEQALRLAISDSRTDEKLQATSYLEKLKSTPEGFQQSLTLIQQIRTTNVQVVFFCFQVIDSVVSSRYSDLDLQTRKQVRDTLWQLLIDHTREPIPFFLRNKLFLLVVLVFRFEYVTNWTNFFIDLIKLKDASMVGLEAFLQICVLIDEEVVCKYIQRDSLNTQLNVEIKDKMRQSDIALLVENWLLIFHRHYQTHAQIATMCLEIFGLYVEWIDLGLILNETFIAQLYECLGKSELQSAACDCLCKVVSKGMNPIDKLELLKRLNLVGVLQNLNGSNDPEFLEQLAKLVNAIGLELCLCVTDSVDVQKNQTVLEMIGSIFPLILEHLGSEYDDTTECLFPFLTHYMIAIKKLQKNRFVAISNENLHRLVRILVLKMKYGSDVDFTSDNSNDDETAFFDMRKSLKVHVEVFSTIDRELCAGVINDIIFIALETLISYNVNPANGFSMEWTDYELAMYLIFIYTESNGTKGTIIYHNGTEFTPIGQILTKMFQSSKNH